MGDRGGKRVSRDGMSEVARDIQLGKRLPFPICRVPAVYLSHRAIGIGRLESGLCLGFEE